MLGGRIGAERQYLGTAEEMIPVMDRMGVRVVNNLTGGFGAGLDDALARFDQKYPGRFCAFTEPIYTDFQEPDYPARQARVHPGTSSAQSM